MNTPPPILLAIEEVRALYADLFVLYEQAAALDPQADALSLQAVNRHIGETQHAIQARMDALNPALLDWRDHRDRFPAPVNQSIEHTLADLEQKIQQARQRILKRAEQLRAACDQIKGTIKSTHSVRKGISGYKVTGRAAPHLYDSDA